MFKVSKLQFKPLLETDGSFSALTKDGKSKYFAMKITDTHFRVYGIDGINDGGTEYHTNEETIKKIINDDWNITVLSYLEN